MAEQRDWTTWLNVGGSAASIIALGYLLLHLPRRGQRAVVAGSMFGGLLGGADLRFKTRTTGGPNYRRYTVEAVDGAGQRVGHADAYFYEGEWAEIAGAQVEPKHQGTGIYPRMLEALRDEAKADGRRGLVSLKSGRFGREATLSWKKAAKRNPRITQKGGDFYLEGLPKKGRIPDSAVDYAMRKLSKQVEKCGITRAQMREGMSVEREHGDVTKRTVEKTARIAAAHICERPDYYRRLKRYVE